MKRTMQLLISASALCIFACAAGAQQAPPPKTDPAKPKAKRVWTNDDVTTLRQPSDVYEEEKRLKAEEAAAKAKEKPAAEGTAAQKPMSREERILPKTLEEAEKRVAGKLYEIGQEQEYIERLRSEFAEAKTDEARAAHQKRLDAALALLEESQEEFKKIDARLQEFRANPSAPTAPEDATSPAGQLEKQIAEKREKVQSYLEYIAELREAITKADTPAARAPLQTKLDGFLALLEKTNAELKTLEGQLQELKTKPAAPPQPAAPKP